MNSNRRLLSLTGTLVWIGSFGFFVAEARAKSSVFTPRVRIAPSLKTAPLTFPTSPAAYNTRLSLSLPVLPVNLSAMARARELGTPLDLRLSWSRRMSASVQQVTHRLGGSGFADLQRGLAAENTATTHGALNRFFAAGPNRSGPETEGFPSATPPQGDDASAQERLASGLNISIRDLLNGAETRETTRSRWEAPPIVKLKADLNTLAVDLIRNEVLTDTGEGIGSGNDAIYDIESLRSRFRLMGGYVVTDSQRDIILHTILGKAMLRSLFPIVETLYHSAIEGRTDLRAALLRVEDGLLGLKTSNSPEEISTGFIQTVENILRRPPTPK